MNLAVQGLLEAKYLHCSSQCASLPFDTALHVLYLELCNTFRSSDSIESLWAASAGQPTAIGVPLFGFFLST
jgi:hypothetical protein